MASLRFNETFNGTFFELNVAWWSPWRKSIYRVCDIWNITQGFVQLISLCRHWNRTRKAICWFNDKHKFLKTLSHSRNQRRQSKITTIFFRCSSLYRLVVGCVFPLHIQFDSSWLDVKCACKNQKLLKIESSTSDVWWEKDTSRNHNVVVVGRLNERHYPPSSDADGLASKRNLCERQQTMAHKRNMFLILRFHFNPVRVELVAPSENWMTFEIRKNDILILMLINLALFFFWVIESHQMEVWQYHTYLEIIIEKKYMLWPIVSPLK